MREEGRDGRGIREGVRAPGIAAASNLPCGYGCAHEICWNPWRMKRILLAYRARTQHTRWDHGWDRQTDGTQQRCTPSTCASTVQRGGIGRFFFYFYTPGGSNWQMCRQCLMIHLFSRKLWHVTSIPGRQKGTMLNFYLLLFWFQFGLISYERLLNPHLLSDGVLKEAAANVCSTL